MSRKKTWEEQQKEAWEADARNAEIAKTQSECGHYDCAPTEWHWSGQIRMMHCNDCGLDDYRDEVE